MTPGVTLASWLMPICLLASACAGPVSSINREAALLSLAPPPEGRTCGVATAPKVLPSAAALVDSVRLISSARTPPGDPPAYALLSLRFDDHGRPTWTRVIETSLGQAQREAIERLVAPSVLPQVEAPSWSMRLKVEISAAPELRVGRSEICPAVPEPGTIDVTTSTRVSTTGRGVRPQAVPSIRTPRLSLLIDVTGRVLQTRLLEGSTDSDVDRAFEQSLRGRRFRPALIDGQGVTAWTEWPLRASSAH